MSAPPLAPPAPACRYCGRPLDAFLPFCGGCATPWRAPEAALPAPRPRSAARAIAEDAPGALNVFWTYVVVLVAAGVGLSLLGASLGARLVLLDLAVLGTTVVLAVLHAPVLLPQVTTSGLKRWETWAAIGALGPLLLLNHLYSGFVVEVTGGGEGLFDQLRAAGFGDAALVLSFCALPAVTEEVAFRGLVQRWLEGVLAPATAIALASALFTAVHLSLLSVPYLFAAGCLLGWLRWRTDSLWPCAVVHFLHNFVVLTVFPG